MVTLRVPAARCTEQARKPLKHNLPTALTHPGYPEQTQRTGRTSLTGGPTFLLGSGPRKKSTVNSELRRCILLGKGSGGMLGDRWCCGWKELDWDEGTVANFAAKESSAMKRLN